MENIAELLETLKTAPYADVEVRAPHCGIIAFAEIAEGDPVSGPSGKWQEYPGTVLAAITRERNERKLFAGVKGTVLRLHKELDGQFVEAGTVLAVLRHPLTKEEVSDRFLMA
ncbi:MAG: biotin attachment protein, partial [Desulfovibrio sp.]|nr:biotin attachment protein [Desulfovibrio sp.]